MWTIFRHTLARMIGQVLGWGLVMALLGWYIIALYDTFSAPDSRQAFTQMMDAYPPELMSFFGDIGRIFEPSGFINFTVFSYMPVVLGIFAIQAGGSLLAGDEEKGTLDLVLAHPVSRTAFFVGRAAAFVAATLCILFIFWLGLVIPLPQTSLAVGVGEMLLPFLSLLGLLLFLGALALLLSMLLPSQRMAVLAAGLLLVASYIINSLGRIDPGLVKLDPYLPLHYYQGGMAIDGVEWGWLAGLLGCALLFSLLAWRLFEKRQIRVSGEAGWHLP
ncbi:MAG TPA: ABC transporter permease subunit [Anaerolineales bacterium]|nr:ABC transporter permease subunit [Anaerolineales bacterium]